jgi:hypothetical protein
MDAVEPRWRTSSYSGGNGACVEIAAWRKSSRSAANGNCLSIGYGQSVIGARDTKLEGDSPVLIFSAAAWRIFTAQLKARQ